MPNPDLLLYLVHGAFWASFGVAGIFLKDRATEESASAPNAVVTSATAATAPFSRTVLAVHILAFAVMYFGLGNTIIPHRVPDWFPGQRVVGAVVIGGGAALMCWARIWFHSWRFRAKLDAGHELATGGPFRYLRNPIYMGLNLLALGSAIWAPTVFTWVGVLLMATGSDLRGRAEEQVLKDAFGPAYTAYASRTARFLPGIY